MMRVRICELNVGDLFRMHGRELEVHKIDGGRLHWRLTDSSYHYGGTLGANSQQYVELIINT